MKKIYCAGPLFNMKEKEEMADIASCLEAEGFKVFLPHRDGLEFANVVKNLVDLGYPEARSNDLLNRAIFALDVFQVIDSDGLILNMNGRVPDEGAMVEAGIAWNAKKKVVIYKNDVRTLLGSNDNPLILGLADFTLVEDIKKIPKAFERAFGLNAEDGSVRPGCRVSDAIGVGSKIYKLLRECGSVDGNFCNDLLKILES